MSAVLKHNDNDSTVTCDFNVFLHTYILILDTIYIFFLDIYIESLRSHASPDQGKSCANVDALWAWSHKFYGKRTLKDDIYAGVKGYIWLIDSIYKC